jgi:hypothetical protein
VLGCAGLCAELFERTLLQVVKNIEVDRLYHHSGDPVPLGTILQAFNIHVLFVGLL